MIRQKNDIKSQLKRFVISALKFQSVTKNIVGITKQYAIVWSWNINNEKLLPLGGISIYYLVE